MIDPANHGATMPIRFRCGHCNQLMGIARRKAGALVRCPACHRDVTVPPPGSEETQPAGQPAGEGRRPPQGLFDRDDFDALLGGPASADLPVAVPPPPSPEVLASATAGATAEAAAGAVAGATVAPVPGVILTPGRLTALTVAFILLVAVAFALGLVVGKYAL